MQSEIKKIKYTHLGLVGGAPGISGMGGLRPTGLRGEGSERGSSEEGVVLRVGPVESAANGSTDVRLEGMATGDRG